MTDDQLVDLIGAEGPSGAQDHLAACSDCRSRYELWTERIEALREMERETLDESELHRLRVLYRQLGPGEGRAATWVARLLRSSAAAPAAARGVASGQIMEYGAGPFRVLLRVGARGSRPAVSVVGQIWSNDDAGTIGGTFALTADDGGARLSDVDRFGEFHLTDIAPGSYTGMWWFEDRIMLVPGVEIGTDGES